MWNGVVYAGLPHLQGPIVPERMRPAVQEEADVHGGHLAAIKTGRPGVQRGAGCSERSHYWGAQARLKRWQ